MNLEPSNILTLQNLYTGSLATGAASNIAAATNQNFSNQLNDIQTNANNSYNAYTNNNNLSYSNSLQASNDYNQTSNYYNNYSNNVNNTHVNSNNSSSNNSANNQTTSTNNSTNTSSSSTSSVNNSQNRNSSSQTTSSISRQLYAILAQLGVVANAVPANNNNTINNSVNTPASSGQQTGALTEDDINHLGKVIQVLQSYLVNNSGTATQQNTTDTPVSPQLISQAVNNAVTNLQANAGPNGTVDISQLGASLLQALGNLAQLLPKQASNGQAVPTTTEATIINPAGALPITSLQGASQALKSAKSKLQSPTVSAQDLKLSPLATLPVGNNITSVNNLGNNLLNSQTKQSLFSFSNQMAQNPQSFMPNHSNATDAKAITPQPIISNIAASVAGTTSSALGNSLGSQASSLIDKIQGVSSTSGQGTLSFADSIAQEYGSIGGNLTGSASDNISSFQKFIGTGQDYSQSTTTNRFSDSDSVMAQIKFGLNNTSNNDSDRTVSVQLSPKELGNIDVHMKTSSDGKTHVTIMAEKTDTLNLLQKESTSLKGMLQDALKTDSSNLSFNFQDSSSGQSGQGNYYNNAGYNNNLTNDSETTDIAPILANYSQSLLVQQGLDIRV